MPFYSKSSDFAINYFNSNLKIGLTNNKLKSNIEKYGYNRISQKKNRSVFNKILFNFYIKGKKAVSDLKTNC